MGIFHPRGVKCSPTVSVSAMFAGSSRSFGTTIGRMTVPHSYGL